MTRKARQSEKENYTLIKETRLFIRRSFQRRIRMRRMPQRPLTWIEGLLQTEDERQTEFCHSSPAFASYQSVKVHLREKRFVKAQTIFPFGAACPKNFFIPLPSPRGRDLDTSKLSFTVKVTSLLHIPPYPLPIYLDLVLPFSFQYS